MAPPEGFINIRVMIQRKDANNFRTYELVWLPAVPRIGEHLAIIEDDRQSFYKVAGIFHAVPFKGLTEVLAVYDGNEAKVQQSLLLPVKQ